MGQFWKDGEPASFPAGVRISGREAARSKLARQWCHGEKRGNFDMLHNSFTAICAVLMTLSTFSATLVVLGDGPTAIASQLA